MLFYRNAYGLTLVNTVTMDKLRQPACLKSPVCSDVLTRTSRSSARPAGRKPPGEPMGIPHSWCRSTLIRCHGLGACSSFPAGPRPLPHLRPPAMVRWPDTIAYEAFQLPGPLAACSLPIPRATGRYDQVARTRQGTRKWCFTESAGINVLMPAHRPT